MQVQQITIFLAVCTLSVLVLAYAAEEPDPVFLYRLRDLAARAAVANELPELFADVDDYKRGGKGIHVHSGINFGKRREAGNNGRSSKRMRLHKGLSFGKRAPVDAYNPWEEQDAYNPVWDLDEFN